MRLQRDVEQLINQNPAGLPAAAAAAAIEVRTLAVLAAAALAGAGRSRKPRRSMPRAPPEQVGERYDGYLGVAAPVSAAVRSQVAAINIRRRSLYSSLAARKGASPQDVGVTAGCQLLARLGVGQSYLLADGVWRRRAAGQGSVAPDYCR